jgi:inorganic pyrophosphatase
LIRDHEIAASITRLGYPPAALIPASVSSLRARPDARNHCIYNNEYLSLYCNPYSVTGEKMNLDRVGSGTDIPNDFNVIIEIPMNADPIKYEVDKDTGAMFVDRFMSTCMHYPCNYGYIPHTLSDDGDPVDVLVISPVPLITGVVVRCRPLGMLRMTDEAGEDAKLLAVPISKLCNLYQDIESHEDLPQLIRSQIAHFFAHYKDLEEGKWVKIQGWDGVELAKSEIMAGIQRYNSTLNKPMF